MSTIAFVAGGWGGGGWRLVLAGAIGFATIAGVAACARLELDPVKDTGGNDAEPPTDTDEGCNTSYPAAKGCPDFKWACWPMATLSPGPGNYESKTICGDNVVIDKTTRLMWARDQEPGGYSWDNANKACKDSRRAGFSDWRLPTRIELVSLVDFGKKTLPTIDTTTFPSPTSLYVWSSSWAWFVNFGGWDATGHNDPSAAYGVRCVR